jgi:hypothetical protein
MTRNEIEKPQTVEKNGNKNTRQVKNEALDNRNHGDTKEPRDRR